LDLKCRTFLCVLLYAGLRKGEALSLMKKDIDLKEKTISIGKTLIDKGNHPDILVQHLTDFMASTDTMYVFTSVVGKIT